MTTEYEKFLFAAEVGQMLQVSPKTVTRWANEGKLPYSRTLGGHRRFPASSIRQLALGLEGNWLSVDDIIRKMEGGQ